MKFYRNKENDFSYWNLIKSFKLTAVYSYHFVNFFKNGLEYNSKNASYVDKDGYKSFYLNNTLYGTNYDFTKESWRRFVRKLKLQAFL